MARYYLARYTPFVSVAFLMVAMGLFNTLVPLRLKALNNSEFIIGTIGSIYYLGMFVGSMSILKFLDRVGSLKTFIFAALLLALSTLLPGFEDDLIFWAVTRFLAGFSLAWLYVVVESWLLKVSNPRNRGKNLAFYMIVLYLGQAVGQLFLGVTGIMTILPFMIAAFLAFISIFPVMSVKDSMPNIKIPDAIGFFNLYKISPTGILGCVLSGALLGSIYSLMPIYFRDSGYDVASVATLMSLVIAGGVVLQYPFGLLADCMDRRFVLLMLCVLGIVVSVVMLGLEHLAQYGELVVYVLVFIFGGVLFSIYPTSLNHTCDYVDHSYIVEVTQGMMLAYGIGSVFGPVTISYAMKTFGDEWIFYTFIIALSLMIIFMIFRIISSEKAIGVGADYVAAPPHVELDKD